MKTDPIEILRAAAARQTGKAESDLTEAELTGFVSKVAPKPKVLQRKINESNSRSEEIIKRIDRVVKSTQRMTNG